MSNLATFDPSKELTLYFRVARAGRKQFVFTNSDGSAYSFVYREIELNIYRSPGSRTKLVELTIGSGITVTSNTVTCAITSDLSNIEEGYYYWELYRPDIEKTWVSGDCIFHNGKFSGLDSETSSLTITDEGIEIGIEVI